MQFVARRYDTLEIVSVRVEQGVIQSLEPHVPDSAERPWPLLAPGLVDLQVNGSGGRDFSATSLATADVARIAVDLLSQGVTSFCPTVTTQGPDHLTQALARIARACDSDSQLASQVAGIHLEGPYISPEDGPRGAHLREFARAPDWDEFQRLQAAAGGRISVLTMSPEYPQAASFIARVVQAGTLVAIGHTSANSEQIKAAVDAGARLSTHLGNGAHGQLRRHPNYLWDQLAEDRLLASLIVDGHHLPAAVVQTFIRAKTPERCVLISDLTGMAGQPPGRYDTPGLGAVEVLEDGRLVVAGQRQMLAGAALPMTVGIANVMRFAGLSLRQALEMASVRPAALLGLRGGGLEVGSPADLMLFQLPGADGAEPLGRLTVLATIKAGRLVFGVLRPRAS